MKVFTTIDLNGRECVIHEPDTYAIIRASVSHALHRKEFPDVDLLYYILAEMLLIDKSKVSIQLFLELNYDDYLMIAEVTNVLFTSISSMLK